MLDSQFTYAQERGREGAGPIYKCKFYFTCQPSPISPSWGHKKWEQGSIFTLNLLEVYICLPDVFCLTPASVFILQSVVYLEYSMKVYNT